MQVTSATETVNSDTATVTVLDVFGGVPIEGFPGYFASPWYKNYFAVEEFLPWRFHDEHGWQFLADTSTEDVIFVYDLGFGTWLFTNEETYRFFYIFSRLVFLPEGFYFSFAGNTPELRFFQRFDGEIISLPPSN